MGWASVGDRPSLRSYIILTVGFIFVAFLCAVGRQAHAQGSQPCPNQIPVTPAPPNLAAPAATLVGSDVCEPTSGVSGVPFRYFDDYSWRTFIALVWPAKAGQRGIADPAQNLGVSGVPLVFETYKADWETFQPNAVGPTEWSSFATTSVPCSNAQDVKPGDLVLGSFNEMGNVGEAGVERFVNVLVAQNTTYVRYLAAYNEIEFNDIFSRKLYLAKNVPTPSTAQPAVRSPNGAITIKSSWIEMTAGIAHPERFYTRSAWVKDLKTAACVKTTVGLVGLHIVQKTPTRAQWIWTTFEQVDNVPPPNTQAAATFNKGDGTPMPTLGTLSADYLVATASASPPPPFNVERKMPIAGMTQATKAPGDTASTNALWQAVLQKQGAVWQFYQLTMTQWPTTANSPQTDGSPSNTFPGLGATTAFANTTMETFDQTRVFASCMACHNSTRTSDFIWSLPMNAGTPPSAAEAASGNPRSQRAAALTALEAIMEQSRK